MKQNSSLFFTNYLLLACVEVSYSDTNSNSKQTHTLNHTTSCHAAAAPAVVIEIQSPHTIPLAYVRLPFFLLFVGEAQKNYKQ